MIITREGAKQYEHSLDHGLEFFSKAGSLFKNKGSFYGHEESVLSLFQKVWVVDEILALKLLFWLRDCRGGAGNRSGFRECLKWLASNKLFAPWVISNIELIVKYGRWDDLRSLFGTFAEKEAVKLWAKGIEEKNVLSAKWADRKDKPLKHALCIKEEGEFRKLLAKIRKAHIVEHKMSTRVWNEIDYHTVPSLAMARYSNAFKRHDFKRFDQYKTNLKEGKTTIHASVLFPHDCVRTVKNGDVEIAEHQFNNLPNYLGDVNERIIVISDTSGSMCAPISRNSSVRLVDVSQGMALYCSDKIGKDNPFYRKFIGFCSESKFKNWEGMSFSEAVNDPVIFDEAVGETRIDTALNLILKTARFFNLTNEQIPTTLLIVSDMQFHNSIKSDTDGGVDEQLTEIQRSMERWKMNGFNVPKIIYWNLSGYAGSPETKYGNNIALVSGFSPSILKAIFKGDDLSPITIMNRTLEKYVVKSV